MDKLKIDDILLPKDYEPRRGEIRARTLAHKKPRRFAVGPVVALTFEDRETMKFQVMEMCRAEGMSDLAKVQAEIDVYNSLLPGPAELSATLFLEMSSRAQLEEWLPKLPGVEHHVAIHVGDLVVRGVGEEGRSKETVTSSVHYIRFPFTPEAAHAFVGGAGDVRIEVDHPEYRHATTLTAESRASLRRDLAG